MKVVLLALLVAAAAGRSIDNPAESPDQAQAMVKAVHTVEDRARSIPIPPPVQVTSGVINVMGDARKGRVIEIGADGIPIIHGVREPDDPNDTQIYRNARIVNNKLWTAEDEAKANQVEGRSLANSRQARVLTGGGQSQTNEGARLPEFYSKNYLNKERVGVIAESSFEDNISTSSEQVVSYSYLAAPQDSANSASLQKSSNDVVYGSGSAAKPPGQLRATVSASITPAKSSAPVAAPLTSSVAIEPIKIATTSSQTVVAAPSSVHASISNAVPFGHSDQGSNFAVHHEVPGAPSSQFHPSPPHAPATVLPANPNNFIIKDATFQAHPGAPTFNVPIPIPNHHLAQAGSDTYTTFYADELAAHQEAATKKPVFQKMMEPFRKAGAQIYEMASPMLQPMFAAGQRLSQRLRIPERMYEVSDSLALGGVNDYIERTVGAESLPLIAGATALGLLGIGIAAIAANNNITVIGKRSVDDPTQEFMYQLLDDLPLDEGSLLERLEDYSSWTDSKCSKRIFCDVMSFLSDDYMYTFEKRLGFFLSLLNRGNEEESSLKRTADEVMLAVRRRQCNVFTCGGEEVDSSQVVAKGLSGPR